MKILAVIRTSTERQETESSKMKEMVFRFVNKITLKNVNIKGEKAVEINIYGVDGEVVEYIYFYYRNRNKKINRLKCVCLG